MKRMASVKKKTKSNGTSRKPTPTRRLLHRSRFVLCVRNDDYHASLELRKVYRALPDRSAAKEKMLRVIDESGEDYLYLADFFVLISVPKKIQGVFSPRIPCRR
jgi:Ca2+-binding EF-hand superfamily protein